MEGINMDFMDISKMRTSVRKFDQRPVEQEKLDKILEAGRWAPTAVNGQPQRILVLNTPEALDKVRQFCTFGYDKKYVDLAKECEDKANNQNVYYYGAPVVLFVCYDKTACWSHPQSGKSSGATDATIVTTHMMLEAASLGVGSVWISYFDENKARELLSLPESWQPVCMLYLGYPAANTDPKPAPQKGKPRLPLEKTCFYTVPTEE
jgi:nitroreductase